MDNSILINYYNNVLNNAAVSVYTRCDLMPCKLNAAFKVWSEDSAQLKVLF